MDDREGGFIVVHRKLRSSRLYRSLTGEQRSVFHSVLLLANWKPDAILVAGKWHEVKRGELAHSLETIACEAAVSVKVVRSALTKMFADDRSVGGRGPFLTERYVGTEEGTPRRVLTVVNYDEYQSLGHDRGTGQGTTGARVGHGSGTTGAPREPVEPDQPVNHAAARPGPKPVAIHIELEAPLVAALIRDVDFGVTIPRKALEWGRFSALVETVGLPAAVATCNEAAPRSDGYPDRVPLGFLAKVLGDEAKRRCPGASPKPALPEPDEEWLASLGPRRVEVERRWADTRAGIMRAAYPDKRAEFLTRALDGLMAEMAEEAA
jgi:hypothetical protein